MAKDKKVKRAAPNPTGKGGKRFEAGQSGNPAGRPPGAFTKVAREYRRTSYEEFITSLMKYGQMPMKLLEHITKDEENIAFDVMYANWVHKAAMGHVESRQSLTDRLWGKPKDTEIDMDVGSKSDEELEQLAIEAAKYLRDQRKAKNAS